MSQSVDLNEVRRRALEAQNQGTDLPSNPSQQVYTDSEGNIVLNPTTSDRRHLSQIPLKTWASLSRSSKPLKISDITLLSRIGCFSLVARG